MPLFLYSIEPARPEMPDAPTAAEAAAVQAHFAYLQAAFEAAVVRYVGRTLAPPHLGLAIFEAPSEAHAEAFLQQDPAVAQGIFHGRVQPWKQVFPEP